MYWRSNVEHRFLFEKGLRIHNSLHFGVRQDEKGHTEKIRVKVKKKPSLSCLLLLGFFRTVSL